MDEKLITNPAHPRSPRYRHCRLPAVKRLLQLAGVEDAYSASSGSTKTLENTLKATFSAVTDTYGFLTPNLWKENKLVRSPLTSTLTSSARASATRAFAYLQRMDRCVGW